MSLDMLGTVDQTFSTGIVTISVTGGSWQFGEWVEGAQTSTTHNATAQNAPSTDVQFIEDRSGKRFNTVMNFYINDGSTHQVNGTVTHKGTDYTIMSADNRPDRNYCKLITASVSA